MKQKFLLFFTLLCFSISAISQEVLPLLPETSKVGFTEVIKLDSSLDAATIYGRAQSWFNTNYKKAKPVIQHSDRIDGVITGKATFNCKMHTFIPNDGYVTYTITVSSKKGKYKYEITDLHWRSLTNSTEFNAEDLLPDAKLAKNNKKAAHKTSEEINQNINSIIENLKTFMAKDNNW